ncbi:hypothetical protein M0R45_017027 [Rubus argutus]|uniref:TF-B3 domain-containing protein n=1 Tax=Rubus argutus TaxID=59490 RepID=A0AAW1XVT0_RUBAR
MASSSRRQGKRLAIPEKTPGFFKVVLNEALQDGRLIHPTYLIHHVQITTSFANKYICTRGQTRNVDLRVPYGEIWSAESSVKAYGKGGEYVRIHGGWKKFSRDNHLQVGDALVIEMIEQQPKITFEVHIYRA